MQPLVCLDRRTAQVFLRSDWNCCGCVSRSPLGILHKSVAQSMAQISACNGNVRSNVEVRLKRSCVESDLNECLSTVSMKTDVPGPYPARSV